MQYNVFLEAVGKKFSEKSVQKTLNICKDPCRSPVVLT